MHRSALVALVSSALLVSVACSTESAGGGEGPVVGPETPDGPAVDGGGPPPPSCTKASDCPSKVCVAGACAAPTPTDGVQNGTETDVDCGGGAPKCGDDKRCSVAGDCASGVCRDVGAGLVCQAPSATDGVKNGGESDVDCGGAKAPKCADGKTCAARGDCTSDVCEAGKCKPPAIDGVKNGSETDVDCGGPAAPRCADNLACAADTDCTSDVCKDAGTGMRCQPPSPTDRKKNGTETDVDCGGAPGNPRCATGKTCTVHADCASDGCAYNGRCADRRSCTVQNGGDTCGFGGAGSVGPAQYESCCATAPAGAGGVAMNKYQVTSGRMRAFLTRVNGNVRGFVQQARAAGRIPVSRASSTASSPAAIAGVSLMRPEWDLYLPVSMEGNANAGELTDTFYESSVPVQGIYTSAYRWVGGSMFDGQDLPLQGCSVSSPGTHTYWMPANVQKDYFGDKPHEHSQAVYDTKPLQCVPYLIAQAFCIWDGGRLETFDEWKAAMVAPTSTTTPPWGATPTMKGQSSDFYYAARFPFASDEKLRDPVYRTQYGLPATVAPTATQSIEYGSYAYSYEYPNLVASDYVVHIAAPGRLRGRGPFGHADLAGNVMEVTSDITTNDASPKRANARWSSNGSFEGHGFSRNIQWNNFSIVNKYGKQGLRCVYP